MTDYIEYLVWIPVMIVPVFIFAARPHSRLAWRIGRIVAAIAIFYLGYNLMLHIIAIYECEPVCRWGGGKITKVRKDEAMILGWIPALIYVSVWELAWRVWYRKKIKEIQRRDVGFLFSSVVIFLSIFLLLLIYSGLVYRTEFFKGSMLFLLLLIFCLRALVQGFVPTAITTFIEMISGSLGWR